MTVEKKVKVKKGGDSFLRLMTGPFEMRNLIHKKGAN